MSIKTVYADGWKLRVVNQTLRQHGYKTAKAGYIVNIVTSADPMRPDQQQMLLDEIAQGIQEYTEQPTR